MSLNTIQKEPTKRTELLLTGSEAHMLSSESLGCFHNLVSFIYTGGQGKEIALAEVYEMVLDSLHFHA